MAGRRFNFGDEDTYIPSRFSPRVARNFSFEENDERFDEPSIGQGYQPRQREEEDDPYNDIITRYKKVLGEDAPALGRYRSAMQNMPRREDYDLNKWGKLGAALSGFGAGWKDPAEGVKVASALREAPYHRAQSDYEKNLENLGEEVNFEAKDRANKMKGLDLELEGYKDRVKATNQRRLDESLINRRGVQNTADLRRLGLDESKFNLDYYNTLTDNEREDYLADSLAKNRTDQIALGNRNAATGEMNARTSRGQLGVAQGRLNFDTGPKFNFEQDKFQNEFFQRGEEEVGRNRRDQNNQSQSWINPSSEKTASELALNEVLTNFPGYRNFIDASADPPMIRRDLSPQVLNSPEFQKFKTEYQGRLQRKLNSPRSTGGSRYEILPEEQ